MKRTRLDTPKTMCQLPPLSHQKEVPLVLAHHPLSVSTDVAQLSGVLGTLGSGSGPRRRRKLGGLASLPQYAAYLGTRKKSIATFIMLEANGRRRADTFKIAGEVGVTPSGSVHCPGSLCRLQFWGISRHYGFPTGFPRPAHIPTLSPCFH